MSAGEVAGRVVTLGRQRKMRPTARSWPVPADPLVTPAGLPPGWAASLADESRRALVADAERIMAGSTSWLGIERGDLMSPDWHADGAGGPSAPRGYAFDVDVRNVERIGVVKLTWELNRHHHLVTLAAAHAITGDESFAERCRDQLLDWLSANPHLIGVNWFSGIELGIRLVSWAWIRRFLDGWDGVTVLDTDPAWNGAIEAHLHHLAVFESGGSSANNHVIAEAAGRLVGALAFTSGDVLQNHLDTGLELLVGELERQTFASGVNRELATEYHGFVMELAACAAIEFAAAGREIPQTLRRVISAMADASASMLDESGNPPRQGDGDGGIALCVDGRPNSEIGSRLALVDALVGRSDHWPVGEPDARSVAVAALVGDVGPIAEGRLPAWDVAADAGMVIGRARVAGCELWTRLDAGPFGWLSIGAHAHADALAVEVRHGGVDLFGDPGTYTYAPDKPERGRFRSTRYHCTLELDGQDQVPAWGAFLWGGAADAELVALTRDSRCWSATASHAAYEGAVHTRTMSLVGDEPDESEGGFVEIVDELVSDRARPARLTFLLGPGVDCRLETSGEALLSWIGDHGRGFAAVAELPAGFDWAVERGGPEDGWWAPSYGELEPTNVLIGTSVVGPGLHQWCTRLGHFREVVWDRPPA